MASVKNHMPMLLLFLRRTMARLASVDMARFEKENPLVCVTTGMEHSGTTLASQLLNGHPRVASGVECGLLLSHIVDFHKIEPFYEWLCGDGWGRALLPQHREKLLKARSYAEAYCLLGRFKGLGQEDSRLRYIFTGSNLIYDKTPRYVYQLGRIAKK